MYQEPAAAHETVQSADGTTWYSMSAGMPAPEPISSIHGEMSHISSYDTGAPAAYQTPQFTGDVSESAHVAATFPGIPEGTTLRTADSGVIEARYQDGSGGALYNSAQYNEPSSAYETVRSSDGSTWYSMSQGAPAPEPRLEPVYDSGDRTRAGTYTEDTTARSGGGLSAAAQDYNRAQFQQFMPGYEQRVSNVDGSRRTDGIVEVRHNDGSATAFYDRAMYQPPRGDYQVYEDRRGGQWYAIPGTPTVERRPVYQDGKPVYDGDKLRTVNVESIRYKTTLTKFEDPKKRDPGDRKPPTSKRK